MARMPRMRTFVAVALNDAIRRRAVALQEELARLGTSVKWVEPENLHVTMLFLGEVDARELLDVCKAVRAGAAKHAPFSLRVAGVGGFPNLRRPRTLWLGVADGAAELIQLHADLEENMVELGCYRREGRAYAPHITLGRVRGDDLTPELQAAFQKHVDWNGGTMHVSEIQVLSSELTSDGPVYTVLSREKLHGPDAVLE